jgi:glyoxylase I family protein
MRNVAEPPRQVKRRAGAKFRALRAGSAYKWPMDLSLEHIGLSARAPATLKDWYVKVLGAKVVFDSGRTPPMFLLAIRGGVMIEIYAGDRALPETGNNQLNGWRHVALRVDSIEAAKADLEALGAVFSEQIKPAGGAGRVLFLQDPEGNLLHLVERPAGWGS